MNGVRDGEKLDECETYSIKHDGSIVYSVAFFGDLSSFGFAKSVGNISGKSISRAFYLRI